MGSGDLGVMVLAAGEATRLRPLTARRAKAVVPFLNRPMLDHTLDWIRRCGFDRVVINLHHAPESIVKAYGRRAFDMRVEYSHEPELLGTGGGPRAALDRLEATTLLVNGDVVAMLALGPLLRQHGTAGALATLGLYDGASADGYPRVVASADGRLLRFPGDAVPAGVDDLRGGVFAGVHLIERRALELLPERTPCGSVDPLYRRLLDAELPIGALPLAGSWYEVGTPALYIDNQLDCLRRGAAPLAIRGADRMLDAGYVSIHAHLETLRLRPPFLLGAGVRVRHGSWLEGVVAGDRVRVESGCRVDQAILWKDARLGARCRLRRVVVMDGVEVPAGTEATSVVFTLDGAVPFDDPGAEL